MINLYVFDFDNNFKLVKNLDIAISDLFKMSFILYLKKYSTIWGRPRPKTIFFTNVGNAFILLIFSIFESFENSLSPMMMIHVSTAAEIFSLKYSIFIKTLSLCFFLLNSLKYSWGTSITEPFLIPILE